jgi:hypothetical protein
MYFDTSIYDTIVAHIIIDDVTGCWMYRGTDNGQGYKLISLDGKMHGAHRVMYGCVVGPIPTGKEIHHLCYHRGCVNPAHLQAVTHQENVAHTEAYDHLRWERLYLFVEAYPEVEVCSTVCVASTTLATLWNCLSNNIPTYLRTLTVVYQHQFQWECIQPGRGPKPAQFRLWIDPMLLAELRILAETVSPMV